MEQNIFTAEELKDQEIVSGDFVIKKLNYHPADIIHLLDLDKIKAYKRYSVPATSFQKAPEYRMLRHYEAKTLKDDRVPGLYFSRKEIENLDVRKAGRKVTDKDAFTEYAVFLKKENPGLKKMQALKMKRLRDLYPTNVADDTIRKALATAWKEEGIDTNDKSGRPKNVLKHP